MPDPLSVFEMSLQCKKCSEPKKANKSFLKNDCSCNVISIESSPNSSQDTKEENKLFKPKPLNTRTKKATNTLISNKEYPVSKDAMNKEFCRSKKSSQECNVEVDKPKSSKSMDYSNTKDCMSRNKEYARNKEYNIEVDNSKTSSTDIDIDEEDKAHKSKVAKITFKTAKEQLLASNPAARRTLGASRKAQAKFVSPMVGAV